MKQPSPETLSVDKKAYQTPVSAELGNLLLLQTHFANCNDVVFIDFHMACGINASVVYIRGMVDLELLDGHVLEPLKGMHASNIGSMDMVKESITISNRDEVSTIGDVLDEILAGKPVLLIDTLSGALSIGLTSYENVPWKSRWPSLWSGVHVRGSSKV